MTDTAIVLFVFNRPEHTRRVLEGLRDNDIEKLHVFADGPRDDSDTEQVEETRSVVRDVDWCEVDLVERDTNWGLAPSTIDGIDRVLEDHDRIIVLEDDDIPAPDFVDFISACLDEYEDEERVMHVSGYAPPVEIPEEYPYDVYFTRRDSTWGWGTWADAWDHYRREPERLRTELRENEAALKRRLDRGGRDLLPMMRAELNDQIDSWSVWWIWAIMREDGVCVTPVESRIKNIGHDGTGTHSKDTDKYDVQLVDRSAEETTFPPTVEVREDLNRRYNEFNNPDLTTVAKWEVKSLFRRLVR